MYKTKVKMYGELKKLLYSGIQFAFASNVFILIAMMFFKYTNFLAGIDVAVVLGTIIGLIVFNLAKSNKIKAYYRENYRSLADAIHLFSILFWGAIVRMAIFYPLCIVNYVYSKSDYQTLLQGRNLSSLWSLSGPKIIVLLMMIALIYALFFDKKDVLIYDYHNPKTSTNSNFVIAEKMNNYAPVANSQIPSYATPNSSVQNTEDEGDTRRKIRR